MIRTRVGYAGGKTALPTYRAIGDHTETIEIDFDPTVVGYEKLLEMFFASHNACASPWSQQYMSAIFTHGDVQMRLAMATAAKVAKDRGDDVKTLIEPARRFYLAEDYHQKYRLRSRRDVVDELTAIYPKLEDFVNSTAATRLNGYFAGYGSMADFETELPKFGLSKAAEAKARNLAHGLR